MASKALASPVVVCKGGFKFQSTDTQPPAFVPNNFLGSNLYTDFSIDNNDGTFGTCYQRLKSSVMNANNVWYRQSSGGTAFDSAGNLVGLPVMNNIRNSVMQGAAIGNPGIAPTNWSFYQPGNGISSNIAEIGTINNIPYIGVRVFGTSTAALSASVLLGFESSTVAIIGQTWTISSYISINGKYNGSSFLLDPSERGSTGSLIVGHGGYISLSNTLQRYSVTATISGSGTSYVQPLFRMSIANNVTIDFIIRIAAPQLEQSSFANPIQQTYGSAVTNNGPFVASTNYITNNSMVGAVAGTPGTIPTNWYLYNNTGLSSSVINVGTLNGLTYIDLRFFGTAVSGSIGPNIENSTSISAVTGQNWSESVYVALIGGSLTHVSGFYLGVDENNGATYVKSDSNSLQAITSVLTRYTNSFTISGSNTTKIVPWLRFNITAGVVDFTIRIAAPQLEQTAFVSPPILTSGTAATYYPLRATNAGLTTEETRTNLIKNSLATGAVAGSPGTSPTYWQASSSTTIGLTLAIIGSGVSSGVAYVDIRFYGTTTGQYGSFNFDSLISVTLNKTYTYSSYMALVGGSLNNISSVGLKLTSFNSSNVYYSNQIVTATTITSALTRFTTTTIITDSTVASLQPSLYFNMSGTSGQAVDITLRIGLPQLEIGAFATTPIPTSTGAVTRGSDLITASDISWIPQKIGTLAANFILEGVDASGTGTSAKIFSLSDGTINNRISINNMLGTGNTGASLNAVGNASQFSIANSNATLINSFTKSSLAYTSTTVLLTVNGTQIASSSGSYTIPTFSYSGIGNDFVGGVPTFNGTIKQIAAFAYNASATQLQALTV